MKLWFRKEQLKVALSLLKLFIENPKEVPQAKQYALNLFRTKYNSIDAEATFLGLRFTDKIVADDFNKAMRLFKKKVLNDGRLNEIHERQFFTKRSEKKRLARAAGKQRWLRKFAETPGPHQPKKRTNQRKRIS